jgi:predicted DNA-binding transcriptional regulator AlpA
MTTQATLIRLPALVERLGVSPRTIWRWTNRDPSFPKPIRLGPQFRAWDEAEIRGWIEAKKSQRG